MFRRWSVTTLCPGLPDAAFDPDYYLTKRAAVAHVHRARVLGYGRLYAFRLRNERTGKETNL